MNGDKHDDSSRSHFRAAVWSAVIGSIGAVLAAWIGVSFGRGQSEDKLTNLNSELGRRDLEIAQLRKDIEELQRARAQPPGRDNQPSSISTLTPNTNTNVSAEGPPAAPQQMPPSTIATQEEHGIQFELRSCRLSGSEVTCNFLVTNRTEDDKRVSICAHCYRIGSRVVSTEGDESLGTMGYLGSGPNREDGLVLEPGIPIKGNLTFSGVRPTEKLKLLEIAFIIWTHTMDDYQVRFHDVPLT